ncbi:hypothetical protein AWU65_14635 [Paenibacillus glucanolyticus]|uniref:Uncharacterized protein n=1 Tax=Paenibacillus glucanolyticus TaxID=59843 RepID=A0A163K9I0_9BACL|nr:hypothetical protein [Paenibacillus glucanolyticus]KZS47074.1 hypothetical protein AWU65_14635 [Paenibacillus glucanolyticus]
MKHYIFVAGFDYQFKNVDFYLLCDNRVKRILVANKTKEDLTFKIFDFRRGDLISLSVTYPKGKLTILTSKLTPSPYKKLTLDNYNRSEEHGESHYSLKDGQRNILSILDVYREVQQIGSSVPGSLMELSFFSHAWMGGPILVNSSDDERVYITNRSTSTSVAFDLPSGARDPDDMDPRATKDFTYPAMDDASLKNFQQAFHKTGYVWIWGCAFYKHLHEFLTKIEKHSAYKETGLHDDTIFKFTNLDQIYRQMLENWLPEFNTLFTNKTRIELKFKHLKYLFSKMVVASYSYQIAKNARVKTYGGLLGTFSDFDKGPPLPLMRINRSFHRHLNFYKNYLGFSFDPEGRLYGEYNPDYSFSIPSL